MEHPTIEEMKKTIEDLNNGKLQFYEVFSLEFSSIGIIGLL